MLTLNTKLEKPLTIVFLLLIVTFVVMTTYANLDLIEGKHVLFMDELISYEGVQNIFNAKDLLSFWDAISYGGDLRYGRIFWYSAAIVSFLPAKLWGEAGQIIATRMLQFVLLLVSYFILAYTFFKNNLLRYLLIFILLLIPTTVYYSTMPKPEPLQLLFLSIFLYFFVKNNYRFGLFYLFLGIAFGTKISLAPSVVFFYFISLLSPLPKEIPAVVSEKFKLLFVSFSVNIQRMFVKRMILFLSATLFFTVGLIIANPILALSFVQLDYVKAYLSATFFNTTHGADVQSINFLTWLNYIFNDFTSIPSFILFSILLVFLVLSTIKFLSFLHLKKPFMTNLSQSLDSLLRNNFSLVWISSILLLFPIILFVKRIWDFYLHLGVTFLVISIMFQVEEGLTSKNFKFQKFLSVALLTLLLVTLPFSINKAFHELNYLANRSKTEIHAKKLNEYLNLRSVLLEFSQKLGRRLTVYFDPNLYLIDSNEFLQIDRFFGPFLFWDKKYDMIIYYSEHSDKGELPNQTNIFYKESVLEKELYKRFVHDKNPGGDFYYVKSPSSTDDVYILIRNDLFSTIGEK